MAIFTTLVVRYIALSNYLSRSMETKQKTLFNISLKPGPMALFVEQDPFVIISSGSTWKAEKEVTYKDSTVNVDFSFNGIKNQKYSMVLTINEVEQEIKGKLEKSGKNDISKSFLLSIFKL